MGVVAARSRSPSKHFLCVTTSGPLPEFIDRFGPAYKAELAAFIECCRSGASFPTTHHDGLRAQEVISAGMLASSAGPMRWPSTRTRLGS